MNLKTYLTLMSLATLTCWAIFVFVVKIINPEATNWLGFLLFYTSLFLSLSGTGAIFGFFIRFVALRKELVFRSVKAAFRQGFLFAFFIIAILFLLSRGLFGWLNLIFLIIFLTVLEFFLLSYSRDVSIKKPVNSYNSIEED